LIIPAIMDSPASRQGRSMESGSVERADAAATYAAFLKLTDAATVLANTPFMLTRCSSDLRYIFASEAYARMIGHTPEDVVGKKIVEVIGEMGFQTILPHIKSVLSGERVEYEANVLFKDVGPRLLHVITRLIKMLAITFTAGLPRSLTLLSANRLKPRCAKRNRASATWQLSLSPATMQSSART
jgi:PAS domain S-box-containing protein